MSAAAEPIAVRERRRALSRAFAFLRRQALTVYALLAFAYLLVPVVIVVLFSFNHPQGRFNYTWQGFTFDNWIHWDAVPGLRGAVEVSLEIAAISSVCATVLGASLLTLFLTMNVATGFLTIVIAHIMFNISYVVVTVKARLAGFDRHLEEAAMDLGANGWTTFWRVTMPLIAPGILAALLLTFALSVDDFVITNFNAGTTVTFPLFVWGAARAAVFPQINVVGTAIFAVAVIAMLANIVFQNRRARKAA